MIGAVFKPHVRHVKHTIDYMGAAFLAGALTCIILFTSQGGTILPWSSPQLWFTLGHGAGVRSGASSTKNALPSNRSCRSNSSDSARFC